MQIEKNGQSVLSIDDWLKFAPPKGRERHWVDGRSAKELAKVFFRSSAPSMPNELRDLLASSSVLGDVQLNRAWPEHPIRLDSFRGEPRNGDLAAIGNGKAGTVAVTIEAKADESYGPTVAAALSVKRDRSNRPQRISSLAEAVLGASAQEAASLRYQLLHATAATLIFAQEHNAAAAVFVILQFRGAACSPLKLARNDADLEAFLKMLSPASAPIVEGRLCGPFVVPGGGRVPSSIPLFIGKVSVTLSAGVQVAPEAKYCTADEIWRRYPGY